VIELPLSSVRSDSPVNGLRILHLSDLHVRRVPTWSGKLRRLCSALARVECDLVVITGDVMDHPGDETAATNALRTILDALPPARLLAPMGLQALGVLGNHDSMEFARAAGRELKGVRFLRNESIEIPCGKNHLDVALRVLGWSWPEDPLGTMLNSEDLAPQGADLRVSGLGRNEASDPFTIVLAHMPSMIFAAADMALPLILTGHTHAGQVRLSPRLAPHTSSDVPMHLATGVLRLRSTLCCVSRGLGDGVMQGLRINCPWQAPLYTLRRGPLPVLPEGASAQTVHQVMAW
jgi:predicted MPP superfamily phosphohydrolase